MITFQNKGLIDVRAIKTFGVSVKDNASAIGYFGTGLKYALAILLREGCIVVLYRGRKKYTFTTIKSKIRGERFDIVAMNGEALGFTTELGKDWELWQAFRELWCNTTDEGGVISAMETKGEASHTTITVVGEAFEEVYERRGTIMLIDEPDLRLNGVEIRNRRSEYLYYRGIRVQKLRQPSIKTYNVTQSISLTEDRTLKYSWEALNIIKQAIVQCTDVKFITEILTANKDTYEIALDFEDLSKSPGSTFISAADDLSGKHGVNASAMRLCREAMRREMEEHHSQELEGVPAAQLALAKKFCGDIGLSVDSFSIIVVDALEDGDTWLCEDSKIFLTPELFVKGTYALVEVLIRSYLNRDGSMGTVDFLIKRLIGLGEKIDGKALIGIDDDNLPDDEVPF